jgi:transcriptional regulator with XRE-family HTH domain
MEAVNPDNEVRMFTLQVGDSIRGARRALGWTQAELASNAGLSANYVARLERGELGPSLWVAHRLANALGTTIDGMMANQHREAPPIVRTKFARAANGDH